MLLVRDGLQGRYYDPYSQKFLSEDPIGFDGGDTNLYRYVSNQPLLLKDPNGKNSTAALLLMGLVTYWVYKIINPRPLQDHETLEPTPRDQYNPEDHPDLDLPHDHFNNREHEQERLRKIKENNDYYNRSCGMQTQNPRVG